MAGRNRLRGLLDAAATIGTSAAAEPLAGLAGLYGLVTGGVDEGVRRIERTRDKVTYRPGADGQAYLGRLKHLLAPVTNAIESGKSGLGDAAYRVTGSPAAAAAAYTAPDALLSLVGARPALAAGRATQAAAGRVVRTAASGPTMGSPVSQIGAIRAYHGSPHDFDRFSMDHIGRGEGAQAYGHGLYFAGDRKVAESYRDGVPQSRAEAFNGNLDALPQHLQGDAYKLMSIPHGFRREAHLEALRERAGEHFPTIEAMAAKRPHLYEVELAPDETDLLDWDATLADLPQAQQDAFSPLFAGTWPDGSPAPIGSYARLPVRSLYEQAVERMGGHPQVAEALKKAGIPGIRYLDGGSRAAGDGSRNYVMFDDSLIRILDKK